MRVYRRRQDADLYVRIPRTVRVYFAEWRRKSRYSSGLAGRQPTSVAGQGTGGPHLEEILLQAFESPKTMSVRSPHTCRTARQGWDFTLAETSAN